MLLPYIDNWPNDMSPPLFPKEGGGGLLVPHCGFLKWSALGKPDIDLLKSVLGYASNVPFELTNPVVFGGIYGIEFRRSSRLSKDNECRPNELCGETLKELSEANEGVSVDWFDCTEGECRGVG